MYDDIGGDDGDFDYSVVVAPLLVLSSCVSVWMSSSVLLALTQGFDRFVHKSLGGEILWLYLDAEVLVLPPVFYPQDSCFVGRRLFVVNQLAARGTTARLSIYRHLGNTPPRSTV